MTIPMPMAAALVLALAVTSCTVAPDPDAQDDRVVPYSQQWVRARIADFEAGSATGPPVQMLKLQYKHKPAYFLRSPCCDQYDYLYDADGTILCAPSGGIAGGGDGRCPGAVLKR